RGGKYLGTPNDSHTPYLRTFLGFSGLTDVPIAERGFLFVGRSGSGKSTLLDAMSALLTPPSIVDFNAAAREAERSGRDRNLVSYVRGAWADQQDSSSGEIATQYL
ncbi:ATP-binding protein, partial [Burkholderia sp. SIMBA_024]|uniref:ATP-binding protein n=1 Tax=Burkholderia sp. SIMBA_024 TaxID=3085768 RepID=UPI00397BD69C